MRWTVEEFCVGGALLLLVTLTILLAATGNLQGG